MGCMGNAIWLLCGGLLQSIAWAGAGILWCFTIVGIPIGKTCFTMAGLVLCPFGQKVIYGGGTLSWIMNLLWFLVSGLPLALFAAINGVLLCCTIVLIPFGIQCFKIAKLALFPFGTTVI